MSTAKINELLKECDHHDKDNRFMAAMDLCQEMIKLSEAGKIDEALEKKICSQFMKHLNDTSLDVQTNAVKSIQQTASIIKETNLVMIVETLADMVIDASKQEVRDVYSLAIRSTISELHDNAATNMIRAVYPKLAKGLKVGKDEVKEECLEILAEIFRKFHVILNKVNNLIPKDELLKQLCDLLLIQDQSVRKKATVCLGQFSIVLSSKQLQTLIQLIIQRLSVAKQNKPDLLTQIQSLQQVSRHVGGKLSSYFKNLIPLLANMQNLLTPDQSEDISNEINEASLNTIENMIRKCPEQAREQVKEISQIACSGLVYDPNYQYNSGDNDAQADYGMQDDEGGWGSDCYEEDVDNDDDTTWKVRKSSIKIIDALISSCPQALNSFWPSYVDLLSDRFKERDDNVKVDILDTFQNLTKASVTINDPSAITELGLARHNSGVEGAMALVRSNSLRISKQNSLGNKTQERFLSQNSLTTSVEKYYQVIMKNLQKQMQSKSMKVKVSVMKTISVLAFIMNHEQLDSFLPDLVQPIVNCIHENNNELLTYSLTILKQAFKNISINQVSQTARNEAGPLTKFLIACIQHNQSRIASDAIFVTGQFFYQLIDIEGNLDGDFINEALALYDKLHEKLKEQHIDQEVKQASIIAMSKVVSVSHRSLKQPQIDNVIKIYGERLNGELTRESALKGLTMIAKNSNGVVKITGLKEMCPKFVDLLHKAQRSLQISTLEAILALISRYSDQFTASAPLLQTDIAKFISDADILRSQLAIHCAQALMILNKKMAENNKVISQCVLLAGSQLIHNQSIVNDLGNLFKEACKIGLVSKPTIETLVNQVTLSSRSSAKMAAIIIYSDFNTLGSWVKDLYSQIQKTQAGNEEKVIKATLTLGEIGIFKDLSDIKDIIQVLSFLFQHTNDQIRQAAAIALGSVSIGNTNFFLEKVFKLIGDSQHQQKYMFLSTIREIIVNKPECLKDYLGMLMPLYLTQSRSEDEPIRNIVAESIGKLFIAHAPQLSDSLQKALQSDVHVTVATCAKSFKYSAYNDTNTENFAPFINILVKLIKSDDLAVKKNSIDSISQIAFNAYLNCLLSEDLETLVKLALQETPIKKELITTIDLGPFKHTVDNGAPIRKSAFSLLQNLSEKFQFNYAPVVDAVISGFDDTNDDVQVLCLAFMIKLIQVCPMVVISKLDGITERFNRIYYKLAPSLKNDTQTERQLTLLRGVLRVTEALQRNPEALANTAFNQWYSGGILENIEIPVVRELYEKIAISSAQMTI